MSLVLYCINGLFASVCIGVNPGGWGVATPQILGRGSRGGSQVGSWGSWTGHKILLYLIMYRKYMYVQKW